MVVSELQTRVTFEPIGVTGRTACTREGLAEPYDLDNRARPLCALAEVKKELRVPVSWPAVFRRPSDAEIVGLILRITAR